MKAQLHYLRDQISLSREDIYNYKTSYKCIEEEVHSLLFELSLRKKMQRSDIDSNVKQLYHLNKFMELWTLEKLKNEDELWEKMREIEQRKEVLVVRDQNRVIKEQMKEYESEN